MRIIYNNTEVQHNTRSYNVLINRPSLNGRLLEGNVSLDTLSLYDKPAVNKLVESVSQIRLVTEMPADPEPSMTYYVGPDERDLYDVILVNDAKQQIPMGTTQFGQYKSGQGINVKVDNTININTDDTSVYIDSEGYIASSLDTNALPSFTGATASSVGKRGLVPAPTASSSVKLLKGDGTWVSVADVIYPVGSLYMAYTSSINPSTMFPGTSWEKLTSGFILWNDATGGGGTISAGAPNITGRLDTIRGETSWGSIAASGAIYSVSNSNGYCVSYRSESNNYSINFDASRSSSIYGKSNTVQPPAYRVVVWRRTA